MKPQSINAIEFVSTILLFLVFSVSAHGQIKKAFTPRYSSTINGDVTIIANNVLSRTATGSYAGTDGNHDFTDNVFVDIDSDPTTFNSSSANFTNPEPAVGCLNYLRAYLYWAASDKEYEIGTNGQGQPVIITGDGGPEPNWNFNQVRLMLPGQTSYTTVTADEVIYRGRDELFVNDPYVCVKDITSQVQGLTNQFGKYQVANVKATEGRLINHLGRNSGTAGGWQIVFVYENPDLVGKTVTLFDGYVHTTREEGTVDFNFSGFQTVPEGPVIADIVLGALEGDFDIAGDKLQIQGTTGTWTDLSTSQRTVDNFFNSKITLNNINYIDRNPASTNTLGFDAALFPLDNSGNSLIGNSQTLANFRITSDQETYGVYLLGLAVEVYEPDLGALELGTRTDETAFSPGETVPFSLDLKNSGNDDITDLEIEMTIPPQVEFLGPSNLPPGVTFNYNSTTRVLTFIVADGLTDPEDTLYSIDFNLQVKDQCYFLESACSASFQLQATATYSGEINTQTVTSNSSGTFDECGTGNVDPTTITINAPDQVNWSTPADALNRTISCTDTAALNNAQTLEPDTEFCNFTLNKVSGSFVPAPGCTVEGTYTNTFTFTDACGRVSETFTQVITIEDTIDPTFNEELPQDTVAAFDNIPSPATLTASDSCDNNPTVDFVETYIGDNTSTSYTIVRTWTASDCAGNTVEHVQNIFISEDGDPIGLSINDVIVSEDAGTAVLTITHIGLVSGGFTINYATANGTAFQPQDYTQQSSIISFTGSNGETLDITILITDDDIIEAVENFTVQLSQGTNTPSINDATGQVTINDDDLDPNSGVGFDAVDYTFNEDVGTVTFTVTLTGNVSEPFTVDFATDDRLATAGLDYEGQTGTLSFDGNDGETESITITIIDDTIIENQEHFVIDLSNISTDLINITDDRERGNIVDNDAVPGTTGLAFDPTEVTVDEADGTATFNVVLTGNFPEPFTVDYTTTDGTATSGADYTGVSGQLSFTGADGQTQQITVPILEDTLIEATEDFTVTLSNVSLALVAINTANATGNITDNDAVPGTTGLAFDPTEVTVDEDDGTATFNVVLTGNFPEPFTVDYTTTDGTATSGADYTGVSGQLSFTGADGQTQQITVPILEDTLIEATEDFTVTLSNTSLALVAINTANATGNITDNDAVPGTTGLAFDPTEVTVDEDDGTATFNVVLTGNFPEPFTVDYTTTDGTATSGADYTGVSGQLSFTGADGQTQQITVPILEDTLIEATEDFTVTLSNTSLALVAINTANATGNITDNDAVPGTTGLAFDPTEVTVDEDDGTATFNVVLTGNFPEPFTVDYTTTDGTATSGADYTGVSGQLSFTGADGQTQQITVPILEDTLIEATEGFTVTLSNTSLALVAINTTNATGNITDNDAVPGTTGLAFDPTEVTVDEADGTATFNVVLTGNFPEPFTVDYTTTDGTATSGADYTGVSGQLSFTGADGQTQQITVPILEDTLIEATEGFTVTLSNTSLALVAINTANATGNITDNDAVPGTTGLAFDPTEVTVDEDDGTATFNVVLTGNFPEPFTVDYTTTDGTATSGADYTGVSGQLSFTGADGQTQQITVPILEDTLIEATEDFTVTLSNVSLALVAINTANATGNITDNDAVPGTTGLAFDPTEVTVDEDDGTATFNVVLTGNFPEPFTVDYTTTDGTATSGADYTGVSGQLSFTGADGQTQQITVPILEDTLIEATEDFTVTLSNVSLALVAINTANATGNITDNDAVPGTTGLAFDPTEVTVDEDDGTATFNVVLTGNFPEPFTVDYTTTDGTATSGADYTGVSGQLSFTGADGQTQQITVPILEDTLIEATEDFTVTLSNTSLALVAINTANATGNITDNDAVPGTTGLAFDPTEVTVNEADGTATFNVVLTGNFPEPFTVDYTTTDGTATSGADYTGVSGQLSFTGADGQTQQITVPILEDTLIEATEDFTVTLSNTSLALVAINTANATGNITDNDAVPGTTGLAFDPTEVTVDEDDGTATFNVVLTGDVAESFSVSYGTLNGTAEAASDFTAATGTLNFIGNDGESYPITVPIIDDDIIEPTESFLVDLSGLTTTLIGINTPQATGRIVDNDEVPGVTGIAFEATEVTVNEGDGTATFNVVLTGNFPEPFTVDFATVDGTATNPADYTALSGQLTFTGTDGEIQTITVDIIDDIIIEPGENFLVNLTNPSNNLVQINTPQANGIIDDNDAGTGNGVAFESTNVTVNEGDGTATFNVILTGNFPETFTVDYVTADGTATNPADYTETTGQLTFSGTDGEIQQITVTILEDDIIEATENFTVSLSNPSLGLVVINTPSATGNIVDNDAVPGTTGLAFDPTEVTVNEGDGTATFNVILTGNFPETFTVDYVTADGTALNAEDYTEQIGQLTFTGTDGEEQQIIVPIIEDDIIEATENFTVTLSTPSLALVAINTPNATGNIEDNDANPGTTGIAFESPRVTVDEDAGTATFNVVLTGNFPEAFTIDYTTADGTATDTEDYTGVTGQLSFTGTDGEILAITVPIIDDGIIEDTENFTVNLSNASSTLVNINTPSATGNIVDNDAEPGVSGIAFEVTELTVNEADGTATFNVVLTGEFAEPFTVDFTTADGTATDTEDYTGVSGQLSFDGNDGEIQQINVPILEDTLIEALEDFTVNLSNPSSTLVTINTPNATGNIEDNDAEPGVTGIAFQSPRVTVDEDAGTATFNVVLTGEFAEPFTVDFTTADGTATDTEDYTGVSGQLSFTGTDGEILAITVPIIDDGIIEDTENFTVNLSNASSTLVSINTPTATGNIVDNDAVPGTTGIAFETTELTVNEADGTATFNVVLTGEFAEPFTVDFATADGTATDTEDYTAVSGQLSFDGNDGEIQPIVVPILEDNLIEALEDFTVALSNPSSALVTINTPTATGNIEDNDAEPGVTGIAFQSPRVTVDEDAGTATFNVVLTGEFAESFTVDFATADGTATDTEDYTAVSGQLTFDGNDGEIQPIIVPILEDTLIETVENFTVTLSNASSTLVSINTPSATGNIVDNDAEPGVSGIAFETTELTINEADGTATFNVVLTGEFAEPFTVDFATADGTATDTEDYTAVSGQLSFDGNDGEIQPIVVPILEDNLIEALEDFTVALSNPSSALVTINTPTATGNIEDNDAEPGVTGIAFQSPRVTVDEDAGTATFNVVLTGEFAESFTVDFATADGTATDTEDYTAVSGQLTFDGNDGEIQPIIVPILEDTLIETVENFTVTLSNASSTLVSINTPSATGNIVDNDAEPGVSGIAFETTELTINEADGTATFNVVLTGEFAEPFTVDFATADGTATDTEDYTAVSGQLSFDGNDGEIQPIVVPILEDNLIEALEDFTVALSNPSSALVTINTPTATGNIEDNDAEPGVTGIAFEAIDVTVNEADGTATFNVVLTGEFAESFTVDFATTDGTATDTEDYTGVVDQLSFDGNDGEIQQIVVPILEDTLIEATENYTVTLSNPSSTLVNINTPSATGNIVDNDAEPGVSGIAFEATELTVNEADGTATFNVILTGNFQEPFTVDFVTADGTATDTEDYTGASGQLSFDGNDGEIQPIVVPILEDNLIEALEDFTVTLSNPSSALVTINTPTATGNIEDNDAMPGVTGIAFEATEVTVNEADGTAIFNVVLTGNVSEEFTVEFTTADGTAIDTEDYTGETGQLSFAGIDGEVQQIVVPILEDVLIEDMENFTVSLYDISTDLVDINTDSSTGNIIDNDAEPGVTGIAFVPTEVTVNEADGTATFDVVLTGEFQEPITVDFVSTDGTATDSEDYSGVTGQLSFLGNDGEIQQINVPILEDDIIEALENFTVTLSNPSSALVTINTPTATGTIIDNDAMPGVTGIAFEATEVTVNEDDVTAIFNVILTGTLGEPFTVDYITADASATGDIDFVATTGTLNFEGTDGEIQEISVPIIDDILVENPESFFVQLSNLSTDLVGINSGESQGTILDNDSEADFPDDMFVTCEDDIPPVEVLTFNANDCDYTEEFTEEFVGLDDGCPTEYTINRTWTITDCVGNVRTHTQVITIEDNILPNFVEELPQDITISCTETIEPVVLTAIDNCDSEVEVVFTETQSESPSCPSEYVIVRTWTVSDCSGNTNEHVQVITVQDNEAPMFVGDLPEDMIVECEQIPDAVELEAIDNCDPNVMIDFTETVTNDEDCMMGYIVTRVWTAMDCSGNSFSHTQILTIEPSGPIMASDYLEEFSIVCGDMIPEVPEIEFTGGCGDLEVEFTENTEFPDEPADYQIIRTWTVTDACDEQAVFQQIITVVQPKREEIFIEICTGDDPIDLLEYLPELWDTNGIFTADNDGISLDGSILDPSDTLIGEYQIDYSSIVVTCAYYATYYITFDEECIECDREDITISKTVTPNGDGINDYLEIIGGEACGYNFDIMVFNRWGDKVYEAKSYQNNWAGVSPRNAIGGSGDLPSGTYYYIISIPGTEFEPFNGFIFLGN